MRKKKTKPAPLLVAIVGGSASGKTWLADRLQGLLGSKVARLSLDDFYRDRSYLSPARRARINYDHPRAIDWKSVERVLKDCHANRATQVPGYDFATHSRRPRPQTLHPKPVILMDGLWLLRRPSLRKLFTLSIFIECSTKTRLGRRLDRDVKDRGRTRESVKQQFAKCVEPMHALYVAPQARWAKIHLQSPIMNTDLLRITTPLKQESQAAPHRNVRSRK